MVEVVRWYVMGRASLVSMISWESACGVVLRMSPVSQPIMLTKLAPSHNIPPYHLYLIKGVSGKIPNRPLHSFTTLIGLLLRLPTSPFFLWRHLFPQQGFVFINFRIECDAVFRSLRDASVRSVTSWIFGSNWTMRDVIRWRKINLCDGSKQIDVTICLSWRETEAGCAGWTSHQKLPSG